MENLTDTIRAFRESPYSAFPATIRGLEFAAEKIDRPAEEIRYLGEDEITDSDREAIGDPSERAREIASEKFRDLEGDDEGLAVTVYEIADGSRFATAYSIDTSASYEIFLLPIYE